MHTVEIHSFQLLCSTRSLLSDQIFLFVKINILPAVLCHSLRKLYYFVSVLVFIHFESKSFSENIFPINHFINLKKDFLYQNIIVYQSINSFNFFKNDQHVESKLFKKNKLGKFCW